MNTSPSLSQLKRAVQIAEQIEALRAELNGILGEAPATAAAAPTPARRGRKPKAETLALAAAAASNGAEAPRVKRKYNMSPEAREKIAAAQKRRWAKAKRASKKGAGEA